MESIISISNLEKTYPSGFQALKGVTLDIHRGEIFALLGPNGAGKTTLISIVCGIVNASAGQIQVGGHDIITDFRAARKQIGLVPQELALSMFETVWATLRYTRGLYGKAHDDAYLEQILKALSLWDKRNEKIITLSGGMKRRVLIAKALAHQPNVLFLDEPTAGVDVELRQEMWAMIHTLREQGTTVILTTHYIEEAEEMADRIGVINRGELVVVDDKKALMKKLGKKQLTLELEAPLKSVPQAFSEFDLELSECGTELTYTYQKDVNIGSVPAFLDLLERQGVRYRDLHTAESSLEDIFVNLLGAQS